MVETGSKINCIIVDDEPLSVQLIEQYVRDTPDLNWTGSFSNAMDAFAYLSKHPVQLVFMDINMPGINGIKLVESLRQPPQVIFITAYPEYAVEGFELDAVDYLVKPVSFERFLKAVQKAGRRIIDPDKEQPEQFFLFKSGQKLFRVRADDILYIESIGDYVKVHTSDQNLVVHDNLKNLSTVLPSGQFTRIHRSYMVALDKIKYLEGNRVAVGNIILPISNSYRKGLEELLQ